MAETPEMESPSARQDCLVEAQEDSTSVEPEPRSALSPSETTPTTAATPPSAADDVAEDERRSVMQNSCENLVMVCERLDEKPDDEGRPENEQSSDCSRALKQEEEKEVDMGLKMGKEVGMEDEGDSTEGPLQPEEPSKVNSEDAETETTANISRKRPAGSDFLPIGAEIKRIGVEISEEEATQRRNDVRRLSPVLVSQRERTLGEVSLTAESCLFAIDNDGTGNDVESPSLQNEIKDVVVEKGTLGRIDATPSTTECASSNNEDISNRAIGKVNYDSEEEILGVASFASSRCNGFDGTAEPRPDDVADASDEIASGALTEKSVVEAMTSPAPSSPSCRRLMVVLNRCEEADLKRKEMEKLGKAACDRIAEKNSSESRGSVDEECNSQIKETPKKQRWQGDNCSPMTRSKRSESMENVQSPDSSPVLKNCTVVLERMIEVRQAQHSENAEEDTRISKKIEKEPVAPVAVIGKLEENEEVVLTSSSPANEDARASHELDSTETMPSSPEETQEAPPMDVAEAVDTETETETGSDNSSEVSLSIAGIRELRDVDVASTELPCSEAERGELCCVEVAMAPIMTRLEAERPEPYTEDSAESLALATGARDEVRSDGSDSGLGNEIVGDPGPAPAPESDSETSFLDRLPDDILSDKEKGVNQLDSFATSSGTSGTPGQPPLTSFRTLPAKSNLKRRLTDCMESDESRNNADEPVKKKRNIQFDAVTVYYFPRAQGFTCVPSQGGSTLGMSATHTHAERFSLSEHAAEQRRIHRARLAQLRSERSCATNCVTSETASSSEDPSDDTDEEPSDNEELDIDSYYFLQPVPTWQRRALLRAAGVRRIDAVEKDECRDIRASREHCGCGCKGYCDPESCPCSRANVKCQVDRPGFPCGCTRDGCANNSGRIEFNPVRVRTHFIHTLMRLELEKKQREEEGGGEHDRVTDNQGQGGRGGGPLREIGSLGSVMDTGGGDACALPGAGPGGGGGGGGFTTLHYETGHDGGVVTAGCQPEVPGTREDSLDLYAIRDDCYASEDAVDGSQSVVGVQRKLHPEFSQTFQSFSQNSGGGAAGSGGGGGGMSFQQSSYQDYGSPYASLPSTSRVPQFQPAQFQSPNNPAAFAHYGPYGGAQDAANAAALQGACAQAHQSQQPPQQQHTSYESTVFAQEDAASAAQYTNLTNSVQPMSASVVQQMQQGKLEPFSELLSGRYSYYGEMHEPQPQQQQQQPQPQQQQHHHGTYGTHGAGHGTVGKVVEMIEPVQVTGEQQSEATAEDCDENFGEIIKKSMVETVSA